MATIQKFMPIVFAYIYFLIPAAVLIYMIVSSIIRIGTQEAIFRNQDLSGTKGAPEVARSSGGAKESAIPASSSEKKKPAQSAPAEIEDEQKPSANPTQRAKAKRKRKER